MLQDRIRIVAEMYVGFLELIALQLDQLPDTVRAEYKKFILDAYRLSPAIRQCLKEHDSWYSQVLHTIITEAKMEKLEEKHIKPLLRPMSVHDLDALMEIQHDAYEQRFHEDRSFFVNKLNLFPSGCWVCTIHDVVVAYLFSFPIEYSNPPALNREMERLPKASDCYYVHDLAVRRAYQGIHIGKLLAEKVRELASKGGYHQMALIAVQRSQPFWMKHAFVIAPESQQITYKLLSYGEDACYMHCDCSTDLQSHV